jgi:hypothetical protein
MPSSETISLDILSFFIFLPFEEGEKGDMINPSRTKPIQKVGGG